MTSDVNFDKLGVTECLGTPKSAIRSKWRCEGCNLSSHFTVKPESIFSKPKYELQTDV